MNIVFWGRYSDKDGNIYKLVGEGTYFKEKNKKMYVLAGIADDILDIKYRDHNADVSDKEKQIDLFVYHLYELTYDEVLIVDPDTPITREEYEQM